MHLFAFEYYCNFIKQEDFNKTEATDESSQAGHKKISKHIGKGHKKALIKWYDKHNELELLRLVTQYKHSYNWNNKDLFKLIHLKPKNEGIFQKYFKIFYYL